MASSTGTRDNYVHFVQEPFDQGSLVRPYIKWEWTLPSGVVVKEALRRAHTHHAQRAEGSGLPDAAARNPDRDLVRRGHALVSGRALRQRRESSGADPKLVERLADALLAAKSPILLTSYAGRTPGASEAIHEARRVRRHPRVRSQHGEQHLARRRRASAASRPGQHIGAGRCRPAGRRRRAVVPARHPRQRGDVLGADRRRRDQGRLADVELPGEPAPAGQQRPHPRAAARSRAGRRRRRRSGRRRRRASTQIAAEQARSASSARPSSPPITGKPGAINAHYLCAELGKRIAPEDIDLREATRNTPAVQQQIPRPLPGTLVRVGGGGLGSSGGMALGTKLARPDRMAIQIVGDGSFYFNVADSVFAVSKQYKLPILTHRARQRRLVGGEGIDAARLSGRRRQGRGRVRGRARDATWTSPRSARRSAPMARSSPIRHEVPAAIERCLKEVRGGRTAMLHACVTRL